MTRQDPGWDKRHGSAALLYAASAQVRIAPGIREDWRDSLADWLDAAAHDAAQIGPDDWALNFANRVLADHINTPDLSDDGQPTLTEGA